MRQPVFAVSACRRTRRAGKHNDTAVTTVTSSEGNEAIYDCTGGKNA